MQAICILLILFIYFSKLSIFQHCHIKEAHCESVHLKSAVFDPYSVTLNFSQFIRVPCDLANPSNYSKCKSNHTHDLFLLYASYVIVQLQKYTNTSFEYCLHGAFQNHVS